MLVAVETKHTTIKQQTNKSNSINVLITLAKYNAMKICILVALESQTYIGKANFSNLIETESLASHKPGSQYIINVSSQLEAVNFSMDIDVTKHWNRIGFYSSVL